MVEEAKYDVARRIGEVEIRRYEGMILASVQGASDDEAFGFLFRYISGNNQAREKIEMTSPVVSSPGRREKIAMTAPVLTSQDSFSFVLPAEYSSDTAPVPLDSRVQLVEIRPRLVAALRFRGRARRTQIEDKTQELMTVLRENGIKTIGAPFLMRYNPPFIPGFLRRNEIGIEIES